MNNHLVLNAFWRLLHEVLAADVQAPGLTLMNTVAQERAQLLLDSADDYF